MIRMTEQEALDRMHRAYPAGPVNNEWLLKMVVALGLLRIDDKPRAGACDDEYRDYEERGE